MDTKLHIQAYMADVGQRARAASRTLARATTQEKNAALAAIADAIVAGHALLREANGNDLEGGRERGLDAALLDRLELTDERIEAMRAALQAHSA